jgi:hypothetical protein
LQAVEVRGRVTGFPLSSAWFAFVWSSVPGIALAAAVTAGWFPESLALGLFAISFVGLNLMHMGATWTRVYVRPTWRSKPVERLAVPVAVATFAVLYEAIGGGALLLAAQYFLSFHHGLMQHYGLVRASQRRSGRSIDPRLDMAACLLLPGAALFYRAAAICDVYSGAPLPSLPPALIETMAIAGAAALVAFVWREWRAHRRGERVDPIGVGILCGTNLMWSWVLVAVSHPALPLFAVASGHYIQYLYFVWNAEAREPAETELGVGAWARSELRTSRPRYLIGLLAMGGAVTLLLTFTSLGVRGVAEWFAVRPEGALAIPPWAAAMIGINLEHYWLDHRIWRAPRRAPAPTAVPVSLA